MRYEQARLSPENLNEIKQLLKVLDDLEDEGYNELNTLLDGTHQIRQRLRKLLATHGEIPFPMPKPNLYHTDYGEETHELNALLNRLQGKANASLPRPQHPLIPDIIGYCEWIGYEENTAYVFLLRDALLPYVYYKSRGRKNLYPWLISRQFLAQITGESGADDGIRLTIYDALEKGIHNFNDFRQDCFAGIRAELKRYPQLTRELRRLLQTIHAPHIVVIESGYCGTIPMLLAALDARVEFRLFTTAPFLFSVYDTVAYVKQYEKIRMFETLYSQDVLLKYADFRNETFWVQLANRAEVQQLALGEIKSMLPEADAI